MSNLEKSVRQFKEYVQELEAGCDWERMDFLQKEASICDQLMSYSPISCDFSILEPLVHKVKVMTNPVRMKNHDQTWGTTT